MIRPIGPRPAGVSVARSASLLVFTLVVGSDRRADTPRPCAEPRPGLALRERHSSDAGISRQPKPLIWATAVLTTALLLGVTPVITRGAAPVLVQAAENTGSNVGAVSVSFPVSTTAGNLLVAYVSASATAAGSPALTAPRGWIQAIQTGASATRKDPRAAIFYQQNAIAQAGGSPYTFNLSSVSDVTLRIEEWSGFVASGVLDRTASASKAAATTLVLSGTTAITTQADEMAVALLANSQSSTQSAPTNRFSVVSHIGPTANSIANNKVHAYHYRATLSSIGAQDVAATLSTARPWTGLIATFRLASGPTPNPSPSASPTAAPTPTATPTPAPTPALTPAPTPTPSATPTSTPSPTLSPTPTSSPTLRSGGIQGMGRNILGIDLAALPKSGAAYTRVKALAAKSAKLNYGDIGGPGNAVLLAKAIMGDKAGVLAMVRAAKSTASTGANSLGASRNLAATAIALNLVNAHEEDAWLLSARDMSYANFGSLEQAARKANNHGSAADQSLVAIDLHLGDIAHLESKVIPVVRQRFGDISQGITFSFGDLSWQADPANPVVIGLPGTSKLGVELDGVLAEEQRRQGSFPTFSCGNYNWGASGQLLLTADLLQVAGYRAKDWTSSAVKRAFVRLDQGGCVPAGDDRWQGAMANALYGRALVPEAVGDGKTMCCTDYLYP